MTSLLDTWCPEPHEAAITACAADPSSGIRATGDGWGLVCVVQPGTPTPTLRLQHPAPVQQALALAPGGSLVAVGDDRGTVAVYRTHDGARVFEETRPGDAGPARAMRAMAFAPDGETLATLAVDGKVRVVRLRSSERVGTYADLSGTSLDWDDLGRRLVAVDHLDQPVILDLVASRRLEFPLIPGGAKTVRFVPGGDHAIVLGFSGLFLVDLRAMEVVAERGADRSSGMLTIVPAPDGHRFAVISARSVHTFRYEGLTYEQSARHGAPAPTGVALWDAEGVAVADRNGRLHRPDATASLPPTVCASGVGPWRVVAHENLVAVWKDRHRRRVFQPEVILEPPSAGAALRAAQPEPLGTDGRVVEVRTDRDGHLVAILPEAGPVHVYEGATGRFLFHAGEDTIDTPRMEVAVGVVGAMLERGGLRWFDLRENRTIELDWVHDFAFTGGGTWLAVITPKGQIRILDPRTGEDALTPPDPLGESPVRLLSFVQRRPELLVLDEEGVLGLYDLTPSARDGDPAVAWRIAAFHDVEIDQLWGLEDGRRAVVRIQEPDETATFAYVDLDTGDVVHEVKGVLPYAALDASTGAILEPARGNALLERDHRGHEQVVLRSLPDDAWVAFEASGVLACSANARRMLGLRR